MAKLTEVKPVKIDRLKLYENNAKIHDQKQIDMLKASINEFGFISPVLIDNNYNVIAGHGRIAAAKELKMGTVPCVFIEGLTETQRRAFVLADNKLAELSTWDNDLLAQELDAIDYQVDFESMGFDLDISKALENLTAPGSVNNAAADYGVDQYYGNERERTLRSVNLRAYDASRAYAPYGIPTLEACDYVPSDLIGFNYVLSAKNEDYKKTVHFFIDDYQFERVWNRPFEYIEKLKRFDAVLTPDFSPYADMPKAMQIWNVYRNRMFGQMCQDAGLRVIPTITWSDRDTFEFVINGIEPGGTVAISSVSISKLNADKKYRDIFAEGVEMTIKKLKPKNMIMYGAKVPDFDASGTNIIYFKPRTWKSEV